MRLLRCESSCAVAFFDAYLVVRDESGAVLGENDDGLVGTQSRVLLESAPAGSLTWRRALSMVSVERTNCWCRREKHPSRSTRRSVAR